jgi:carbon storage regulator
VLVLTRRVGERLRIGADIELVVLDVRGRDVRIGVTAPASVAIHREEVYLKIQEANRLAAAGQPDLTGAVATAARQLRARTPKGIATASSG